MKLLTPALAALGSQKAFTFLAGKHIFMNEITGKPFDGDQIPESIPDPTHFGTAETDEQSSGTGTADLEDATICNTQARPQPDISRRGAGRGATVGLT